MTTAEALTILNFKSSAELTVSSVKKEYRRLMMLHHPDVGGEPKAAQDIIEAFDILKKLSSILEYEEKAKQGVKVCLLSLKELIKVYSGECVSLSDEASEINIDTISNYRIILEIRGWYKFNGVTSDISEYVIRNSKDEYTVTVKVSGESCGEIELNIFNKSTRLTISSSNTRVLMRLDKNIRVTIYIER